MSTCYFDTSALLKRYLNESGSGWIRKLADPAYGNIVVVCDLTSVEVFSAFARRQREGTLSPENALILQNQFLAHFEREYLSLPLEAAILSRARNLTRFYPLRSLDSLQLASALEAVDLLDEPIIFLSADNTLLAIAANEGFATDNPNDHL